MQQNNTGLAKRIFASVLDWLVGIVVALLLIWLLQGKVNLVTPIFLFIAFSIFYPILFVGKFGGTLGKLIFGIKVVDYNTGKTIGLKRAFFRMYLGYNFSSQFFGLGFWKIRKNPEKLAWHDELFYTKVVTTRGPLFGIVGVLICVGFMTFWGFNVAPSLLKTVTVPGLLNPPSNRVPTPVSPVGKADPGSMIGKARDSKRLQDVDILVKALELAIADGEITLIDATGDSGTGSQAANGTGWIKFIVPTGKPGLYKYISTLEIDPLNTGANVLYFASTPTDFEINAILESSINTTKMITDGGNDPTRFEAGTDLNLISPE